MDADILDHVRERNWKELAHTFKGHSLLLYGAGGFGLEMLHHLRREGIPVSAFLDQRAAELSPLENIPVYAAEQAPFDRERSIVLFCIVIDKDARRAVIERLTGLGYAHVIEAQSLRCLLVQPDDRLDETIFQYYRRNSDRIRQAETLFSDERSIAIYRNNVQAHASGDYSHHAQWESPMMQQYFPEDVRLTKGYKRFLDCGGYTGDTIAEVIRHEGKIEACAVFEPDAKNFACMVGRLNTLSGKIGQRWLFPCAVADDVGIHPFSAGTGSGALSEQGTCVVQTVSLDQTVPDFHPTYIKMDIEGAEPAALYGAKQIIAQDRPDLAVCVYHAVNHIWDIPLLLNSWNLDYRFFLRSYNAYTMETVLYATAD